MPNSEEGRGKRGAFDILIFMKKITITGAIPFADEQMARLRSLGEVAILTDYKSASEWLAAVQGADVIISDGDYLYENLENLENVFVTYPYIELGAFDSERLKQKGVFVANAQGGNRDAITEWALWMILSLFRNFPVYLNTHEQKPFTLYTNLVGKKALVVGAGSIGTTIGEVCKSFKMNVTYFKRGDDLQAASADADLVINALNCNSSSKNLLDEQFFMALKRGSYYVTFARPYTYAIDGVFKSLDAGILAGAGIDCDPEPVFDTTNAFYQKCLAHKNVLVTPHIAFSAKESGANGREMVVQNVEAFLAGKPQNILVKV